MATIIDALVVTLGLDTRDYEKGTKETERASKKLNDGLGQVRNQVFGVLAAFAGASGVKQFVSHLIEGDAATGRLAANLGVATEELSAYQGAIQKVGGSAADANAAFSLVNDLIQTKIAYGVNGFEGQLANLGITLGRNSTVADTFEKIAAAGEKLDRPYFASRLREIGFTESQITLFSKGTKGLHELTEEARRNGVANLGSAKASQDFLAALADLTAKIQGEARPFIVLLTNAMTDLSHHSSAVKGALEGVAVAALLVGLAIAPEVLAAAAIVAAFGAIGAAVESAGNRFKTGHERMQGFINGLKTIALFASGHPLDAWRFWRANEDIIDKREAERNAADARTRAPAAASASSGGIADFFKRQGYTDAQAAGIEAALMAESGGDPNARNPQSGAVGLAQWLGPRRAEFKRKYGHDLAGSSRAEQLEFIVYELEQGKEQRAGRAVRGATTADEALNRFAALFERPGPGLAGDIERGRRYLNGARGGGSLAATGGSTVSHETHIGTVTVLTSATDAKGIARDIGGALRKQNLTRQADSGLSG